MRGGILQRRLRSLPCSPLSRARPARAPRRWRPAPPPSRDRRRFAAPRSHARIPQAPPDPPAARTPPAQAAFSSLVSYVLLPHLAASITFPPPARGWLTRFLSFWP